MSKQTFSLFLVLAVLLASVLVFFQNPGDALALLFVLLVAALAVIVFVPALTGVPSVLAASLFFIGSLAFSLFNYVQGVRSLELFIAGILSLLGIVMSFAAPVPPQRATVARALPKKKAAKKKRTAKKKARKRGKRK